ncbi:class I SAM-dependent DNA methyltransferase [Bilifractor sp. LCP19S3_H10]|uniref:class I SAM-dependent DNA methyltransferase n=1 Tax=Bilifractor sp. LCP19S3_H10 TaxID=3438736 RepID=UPI003F92B3D1
MGLVKDFLGQTRKPEGLLGKFMLSTMNSGHAKLADWGMDHLSEVAPEEIIELGCGAGRNAGELLRRYPDAHLTAIDYSPLSVEKTAQYNKVMIARGRCTVQQGDVSNLRFEENSYDLATAFETIYFWPGLEKCFAQIANILKPDGFFLICNESDGKDAAGKKFEDIIDGMTCYTPEQIARALNQAGFPEVTTDRHPSKPWITVLARK